MIETVVIEKTVNPFVDIFGPDAKQLFGPVGMFRNFHITPLRKTRSARTRNAKTRNAKTRNALFMILYSIVAGRKQCA
ncbi:hypothetical protein GCM10025776_26930 [Corallincola platygyrae]